jgi:hypothetical protein
LLKRNNGIWKALPVFTGFLIMMPGKFVLNSELTGYFRFGDHLSSFETLVLKLIRFNVCSIFSSTPKEIK